MSWPLLSIIVVSYNRYSHLKRTVETLRDCCTYPNTELILTDDGSRSSQRRLMEKLPFDRFLFAEKNQGMGANVNKGLGAAQGKYILQLQDDWVCTRRSNFAQEAVEALEQFPKIGLLRLTAIENDKIFREQELLYTDSGLGVRISVLGKPNSYDGIYVYSDNPHIKRESFHAKLGNYIEGSPVGKTEDEFCRRFLQRNIYSVAQVEGHQGQFVHIGDDFSYRRDRWRQNWRYRLNRSFIGRMFLGAYYALPKDARQLTRGKIGEKSR